MDRIRRLCIASALVGNLALAGCSDLSLGANDIDLDRVLTITAEVMASQQSMLDAVDENELNPDMAFVGLAAALQARYNGADPALHDAAIGVAPTYDASLFAYEDANGNSEYEEGSENGLFMIEIDGENQRIIASGRSGAVDDVRIGGTGLFAGYLLGSLLSRQQFAGVDTNRLASKQPVSARNARARARAGSGSHSKGK